MKTNTILFVLAILFALVAAFAGMIWIYYVALWVGIPCLLVSYLLWKKIKSDGKQRNIVIPILLVIAMIASLSALVHWLINLYAVDCL